MLGINVIFKHRSPILLSILSRTNYSTVYKMHFSTIFWAHLTLFSAVSVRIDWTFQVFTVWWTVVKQAQENPQSNVN